MYLDNFIGTRRHVIHTADLSSQQLPQSVRHECLAVSNSTSIAFSITSTSDKTLCNLRLATGVGNETCDDNDTSVMVTAPLAERANHGMT